MTVIKIAVGVCLGLLGFYIAAALIGVAIESPDAYSQLAAAFANLISVLFAPIRHQMWSEILLLLVAIYAWHSIDRRVLKSQRLWSLLVWIIFVVVSMTGRAGIAFFLFIVLPITIWVAGRVVMSREKRFGRTDGP